jgi:hypothetical protein
MKLYRNLLIAAALTPAISFTAASAAPKGELTCATSYVSGTVLKVDYASRTMVVREDGCGRETTVLVPEGRTVALSQIGNLANESTVIPFERAHRGIRVKMLTSPARGNDALAVAR